MHTYNVYTLLIHAEVPRGPCGEHIRTHTLVNEQFCSRSKACVNLYHEKILNSVILIQRRRKPKHNSQLLSA